MRIPLLTTIALLISSIALADDQKNHESMYGFLAGSYKVIGKEIGNNNTYYGTVRMISKGDHLSVTRIIKGTTFQGLGHIEHALEDDEIHVLRVRFRYYNIKYETTYQWSGDLYNYARISGHLYRPNIKTDSPGLETLFIDHRASE